MNLYRVLTEQVQQHPEAVVLLAPGHQPLTYRRLLRQVEETVSWLRASGIERSDRVALVLPEGPEMAVAFLAVATGATCAPLNPAYRASEYAAYFAALRPKALLVASGMDTPAVAVAKAQGIMVLDVLLHHEAEAGTFTLQGPRAVCVCRPAYAQPDDVALLLHTSGTTSRPKIVPLTHANLYHSVGNIQAALALSPDDRCLNVMPLFHIHGLVGTLLASIVAGASVVCTPGFYAPQFFEWMAAFHPTWYTAGPTIHQAILARATEHLEVIARTPLRFIRSSSAALPPQVLAALEQVFGIPVIEAYGMTEAAYQIAINPMPPGRRKPGSVGMAAGPQIGIMDAQGTLLAPGETGEIVIRGANVMQGYADDPTANALAFTAGWLRTGDMGFLDAEGYLFLTGRIKELINRGGEKIAPREVDDVLMDHPAVAQAVTFALPDPRLGEDVAAAVVLRQSDAATELELQKFVSQRLAAFKVPRCIVMLDALPKGPTGKLQRLGLATALGLADTPQESDPEHTRPVRDKTYVAPRDELELQLVQIWEPLLGVQPIGAQDNFFELGGHSLLAVHVFAQMEKIFGASFPLALLYQAPTIAQLATLLREQQHLPPSRLLAFRNGGAKPPFFSVHFGDRRLAHCVEDDQPWYGLHLPSWDGNRNPRTVEAIAAEYIHRIRALQSQGPYFLGGYSFGGVVAFEMAHQLHRQEQAVALLVLVNPTDWRRATRGQPTVIRYLKGLGRKMVWMAGELYLVRGRRIPARLRQRYTTEMNLRTVRTYMPQTYPGRLVLFQSTQNGTDVRNTWGLLAADGFELHEVPGDHFTLFEEPYVHVFIAQLTACLQQAQAPTPA